MKNWNKLLAYLDNVYGFKNRIKSSFQKSKQTFDNLTNEHVIQFEYRVQVSNVEVTSKKKNGLFKRQNGGVLEEVLLAIRDRKLK